MSEECAYCQASVNDPDPLPHVDDDDAWEAIAADHGHDCEWVITRAHQRQIVPPNYPLPF